MTQRDDKGKPRRSLSLSKSKKKGSVTAGTCASAATATPITSFFSGQPPSKLACPLCGHLVPKFKINEHIDLQCQNFERGDSSAASASNSVVPSTQLSPRTSPTKSPKRDRRKEEDVKETKTSPYFKKNNNQQPPREIHSKTVVRTIDLGSLSSKLSRRYHKSSERTQSDGEHAPTLPEKETDPPETLSSSQKENVLIESLENKTHSVTVIDLTAQDAEAPAAVARLLNSEKGHDRKQRAQKPETLHAVDAPTLHSTSSKLAKRKKQTGKTSDFRKKAKFDASTEPVELSPGENKAETAAAELHEGEIPSTSSCDPLLRSEEISDISAAVISRDSLPEFGAEQTDSEQTVKSFQPPRLPYYLHNFQTVLQAVLENEDDRALFNQDDMSLVHAFERLSGMLHYQSQIM